jgi:predicted PurR-regulated permease PerM
MAHSQTDSQQGRTIIIAAAIVILLAGLKAAASIVDPILLAAFIAIVTGPAVAFLMRRGVPDTLAVILVLLLAVAALGGIGAIIVGSITDFSQTLPLYQTRLTQLSTSAIDWLRSFGVRVPEEGVSSLVDAANVLDLVSLLFSSIVSLLGDGFLILFTALFILLEGSTFSVKYAAMFGDSITASEGRKKFMATVKNYFIMKTGIALATGICTGILLWALGVGYPVLWGLLAFLLNFVPTIGPFLALVPPALLAVVDGGPSKALAVVIGMVIINTISGNVLEPKLLGKGLGLSPLVVFLSLVIWGWILGPVGMVLSIPLTVTLKVAMDSNPETHWIGTLLGTGREASEEVARKRRLAEKE